MAKFIILFILSSFFTAFGQNCSKERIVGQWLAVGTVTGINTNVDSLKVLIDNSTEHFEAWTFNPDDSFEYTRKDYNPKQRKKRTYTFNDTRCEIILDVKRNAFADWNNLEIIYIDAMYMIYKSNNNPKGYYTTLLRRK